MTSPIEHGLDEEQKVFIRKKVQQLGSISAVESIYHRISLVDEYARQIAHDIYPNHNHSNVTYTRPTVHAQVQTNNKYESYWGYNKETKTEVTTRGYKRRIKRRSLLTEKRPPSEINSHQVARSTKIKLDKEAYLASLERKKARDKQTGGIPEYEEGTLRTEWGTRADHRKMRARDWGDMQNRRKE